MAQINAAPAPALTHEGGKGSRISGLDELRRMLLTCLLWEDTFYETGNEIASRIAELVKEIGPQEPAQIMQLALEARTDHQLRHAPLFLLRELARYTSTPGVGLFVAIGLSVCIQRADELAEFLALYWKDGRCPLAASVKRGLAAAFTKFNGYELAKYNRQDKAVKLRDVLFMVHPKPIPALVGGIQGTPAIDKRRVEQKMSGVTHGPGYKRGPVQRDLEGQGEVWQRLVRGTLHTPDTWEVALSAGAGKKATWERLISEGKLGGMAVLKNLRNMQQAGVEAQTIKDRLYAGCGRALPFRFITAARYAPQFEEALEAAMFRGLADLPLLEGNTGLLVDLSGSMDYPLSTRANRRVATAAVEETRRIDAACGLAMLLREKAGDLRCATFSDRVVEVPPRRGFALRDAIVQSQAHRNTYLRRALETLRAEWPKLDRLIVITDEQSQDGVADAWLPKSYLINVAPYKTGVGYHQGWLHISGWSERVVDYIRQIEQMAQEAK